MTEKEVGATGARSTVSSMEVGWMEVPSMLTLPDAVAIDLLVLPPTPAAAAALAGV